MEGFFSFTLCRENKTHKRYGRQISKKKDSLYSQNSYYFSLPFYMPFSKARR